MKKWGKGMCLLLASMLVLSGCSKQDVIEDESDTTTVVSEMFSDRDSKVTYEESESTIITCNVNSVSVDGEGASVQGSNVLISEEKTYIVKGT